MLASVGKKRNREWELEEDGRPQERFFKDEDLEVFICRQQRRT